MLCLSCAVTSFPEQNTEEHLQIYTDFDLQTQMPARKKTSAESFLFLAATFLPPFPFMSDHFSMRGSPASVSQKHLGRIGGFALSSCRDIFSTRSLSCWAANTVPLFWQSFNNNHSNHHRNNHKPHHSSVTYFTEAQCPKISGCYRVAKHRLDTKQPPVLSWHCKNVVID